MAGEADRIDITLLADGGCRVVDNGRGIPTDIHPIHKISGVEIALTKLHGGGKFGGDGYKVSGGLHGVGVSVVNALSRRLLVEVDRGGKRYTQTFVKGGQPQGKLKVTGDAPRNGRSGPRRGTTVTFWPDDTVFETVEFSARTILERLQMMAFLNKGLEIRFRDERDGSRARAGRLQVRGRHHRFRQARQQDQGEPVLQGRLLRRRRRDLRGRGRVPVEQRVQHRRHPQLRQRHQHGRGRHARRRVQGGAHDRRQQVRAGQAATQGEGPEPCW